MQSAAPDVSQYLETVPPDRRAVLDRLRKECLDILAGYEESMDHGMPCYRKDGVAEVGFASQKRYISLYITKEGVVNAHRDALAGLNVGKGCIRYTRPDRIDFDVVRQLLIDTRESSERPC